MSSEDPFAVSTSSEEVDAPPAPPPINPRAVWTPGGPTPAYITEMRQVEEGRRDAVRAMVRERKEANPLAHWRLRAHQWSSLEDGMSVEDVEDLDDYDSDDPREEYEEYLWDVDVAEHLGHLNWMEERLAAAQRLGTMPDTRGWTKRELRERADETKAEIRDLEERGVEVGRRFSEFQEQMLLAGNDVPTHYFQRELDI